MGRGRAVAALHLDPRDGRFAQRAVHGRQSDRSPDLVDLGVGNPEQPSGQPWLV